MCASKRFPLIGISVGLIACQAQADFFEESSLSLGLRNFYFDRDFKKSDAPKSRVGNWSQGFDLQFKSGYTSGPVQFALETSSQFAYRLDGGGGRGPDSIIPYDRSRKEQAKEYGRSGAAVKLRASKTEVKIGEHRPTLPVAYLDDSRQLVTTYQGATVESKEWDGLTLNAGRFWTFASRESSNREKLYLLGTPDRGSDGLNFAGGTYTFSPALSVSYFYAQLEDIYNQNYLGLTYIADLGDGYSLKNDVRYYKNTGDGQQLNGDYDNKSLGLMTSLRKSGHAFTIAYQEMDGSDPFPLLGYAPQLHLVNWSTIAFYQAEERSWQARYDYDFTKSGIPGLKFMTRYMRGTEIDRGEDLSRGLESERNFVVSYVVQRGALKGLGFEMRNIQIKSRYGSDFDENRLATTYTWKFW
ncbi:OprD family porin [Pseudomonas sp. CFBP 8770]|uniref:OprD family porin n=1 Tax=unclassified Pseudomonas TaxID=196821 RepID=UPI0017863242|nr:MULTISPECIES: OprD family porin [unclassified Pseudomonas]MBD8473203.1 OprD family porin [Pseudomonas sp. CFBP 8773]MBD8646330.1 OprD family porin [Pseudomonas sp. CFBP 8770]MBD8733550.1 OprD family porin [Pseudomonas sp. CFBP 13710]